MSTPAALSSFLRDSAAGKKPAPPPEVRATQRRYGFGGKLPKAVVYSLLAAFALGVMAPLSPAALPHEPVPIVQTNAAPRPAQTAEEIMAKVGAYQPLDIPNGCVVNSLLFEDYLKEVAPGNWSQQAVIQVRTAANGGPRVFHRVVLFQAGKQCYAYDQTYGALPLPKGANPGNPVALQESARLVTEAALTGTYNQHNLGEQPAPVELASPSGDIFQTVQARLGAHRPAVALEYQGQHACAFREGDKIGIYSATGTQQGKLLQPEPAEGLRQMLTSLYGGDGHYREVQGAIAEPGLGREETIALHVLPDPRLPEAAPVGLLAHSLGVP